MWKRTVPASLWLAVALTTSCSDLGTPIEPKPRSELSAGALDFGTVAVGQAADRTLTVRNTGTATLTSMATIDGAGYQITAGASVSVPPDEERAIVVRFAPATTGDFLATLALGADQVSLTGIGADQSPGAAALLDPASIDFGFVGAGLSETRAFQLRSVGTAPLVVNVVSGIADVQVTMGGGPGVIDPGSSRSVTLTYAPQASGRVLGEIAIGPALTTLDVQGVGVTLSFANDVYPIFQQGVCAGCHLSPSWLGTDAATTHANLVNHPSQFYPPAVLIEPFEPTQSVLYEKVIDSGRFGGGMPPGSMLPAHERDRIRIWILEGATNN